MTFLKFGLGTLAFSQLSFGATTVPFDVLNPEAARWFSYGPADRKQSVLVVNVNSYNQDAVWFLTNRGGGVSKLKTPPFTLHEINTLAVSPDEKWLAILSVGEGHPQLSVVSLPQVISGKAKKELALIDPYPGYVKLEGWRGQKVLVESDVPLDLKRENNAPYPDPVGDKTFHFLFDPQTRQYSKAP